VRIEEIAPPSWRERLGGAWDRLLLESSDPTIFLSFPWIESWWRNFGSRLEPRLLALWDESGHLRGLAPLYVRRLGAGRGGPRMLCVMGDEGVGSEYLGILARREEVDTVVSTLSSHLRGSWSLADLRGLREDSSSAGALTRALSQEAPGRVHFERYPCSCIPLPDDYETYLASLPQKFRSTLRYRTNKLVKNFQVRLLRTREESEIAPHLSRFFEMHQARWIAGGHPGSFYTEAKRAFYGEVSREFLRCGWLRFYHLEIDGVVRASQFGFAFNGILHSLQEAFDSDFHPSGVGGVGVVLRGMALSESISEGIHGYDFLGGVADYKSRWGTRVHFIQRTRIGAPGLTGALAFAATAGVRLLKDWGRERSPAWVYRGRERFRSWRRGRHARQVAAGAGEREG